MTKEYDLTPIEYGSHVYKLEVQRILEMESYGVNTARAWNRLNERTIRRRLVPLPLTLLGLIVIAIIGVALLLV
ncbi:MAG: hypothetical protein Tp138OMZ00d2C19078261_4 [Prokaryotic dsDNA virus sp.]|nr:MAG: hypothetical protein Tp138OMZ00d2C19078261_4 [Prokaryotic dsDNA virus sp.]